MKCGHYFCLKCVLLLNIKRKKQDHWQPQRAVPFYTTASTTAATVSSLRTAWGHVLQPLGIKSNQSYARASCPAVHDRASEVPHLQKTSSHHHTPIQKTVHLTPSIKKNLEWRWLVKVILIKKNTAMFFLAMCGKNCEKELCVCVCVMMYVFGTKSPWFDGSCAW